MRGEQAYAERVARGFRPEIPRRWPEPLKELISSAWAQVRPGPGWGVVGKQGGAGRGGYTGLLIWSVRILTQLAPALQAGRQAGDRAAPRMHCWRARSCSAVLACGMH